MPPSIIGLPPDLISLIRLLFSPIAAIAIMIQNLLKSFKGANECEGTPALKAIVVITDAIIKNTINIGNYLLRLKPLLLSFDFLALIIASTKVIGMIARVLVSFTVTALSRV